MASWNGIGGRFGRILRPKIIANDGKEIWGEVLINADKLIITVPQDFLNSAAYPIIIDPTSTFGSGDLDGDGSSTLMTVAQLYGQKLTTPSDAESAVSFTLWCRSSSGTRYAKAVLVNSSKAVVSNGVGEAVSMSVTEAARTSSFATPPTLIPSTDYYICIVCDGTYVIFYYDSVPGTYFYDTSNNYSSPTDPTDGSEGSDRYYEIYCTYNQSAGGSKVPLFMNHYRRMRG